MGWGEAGWSGGGGWGEVGAELWRRGATAHMHQSRAPAADLLLWHSLPSQPAHAASAPHCLPSPSSSHSSPRFGSRFPDGVVTTLHAGDMPALHAALRQPPEPLRSACIFPSFHQLATFASQRPEVRRLGEGGGGVA